MYDLPARYTTIRSTPDLEMFSDVHSGLQEGPALAYSWEELWDDIKGGAGAVVGILGDVLSAGIKQIPSALLASFGVPPQITNMVVDQVVAHVKAEGGAAALTVDWEGLTYNFTSDQIQEIYTQATGVTPPILRRADNNTTLYIVGGVALLAVLLVMRR